MPMTTPLCCPMSPRMIHENLPHGLSGNGQEMRPALPSDACVTDELQVGFMNQRGRLKGMVLSFPVQVSRGKCSQFGVDVLKQLLSGRAVPRFAFVQELSDLRRSARFHGRPIHQSLGTRHDGIVAPATAQVKADDGRPTGAAVAWVQGPAAFANVSRCRKPRKPAWRNTLVYSTTSACSSTNPRQSRVALHPVAARGVILAFIAETDSSALPWVAAVLPFSGMRYDTIPSRRLYGQRCTGPIAAHIASDPSSCRG